MLLFLFSVADFFSRTKSFIDIDFQNSQATKTIHAQIVSQGPGVGGRVLGEVGWSEVG